MKKRLREEYRKALEKKLKRSRASYEIAKKDTIEAEGRMVTRYDSTKTETAWLADGYLKEVKELERIISSLDEDTDTINFGDDIQVDLYIKDKFVKKEGFSLDMELFNKENQLFIGFLCHPVGSLLDLEKGGEKVEYHIRKICKGSVTDRVCMDSLVCVEDEDMEQEYYYLVDHLGGIEIQVDGKEVFCISKQAPMTQLLLLKKKGDMVKTDSGCQYRIISVEQC